MRPFYSRQFLNRFFPLIFYNGKVRYKSTTTFPQIGQPMAYSHPHLVKSHELTPGFTLDEYKQRRKNLFSDLPVNSVVLIASAKEKWMSHDIPYTFRQNTDFYYLTGFDEPNSMLLLVKTEKIEKSIFIVRRRDPENEQWDGPRAGTKYAKELFGADEAFETELFPDIWEKIVNSFLGKQFNFYLTSFTAKTIDDNMVEYIRPYAKNMMSIDGVLHNRRLYKSSQEINQIRKACDIIKKSFLEVSKNIAPKKSEQQIAGVMELTSRINGAKHMSFPCVIASGSNSTIVHYIQNTQIMKDIVLIDSGCEYYGYASDVTRTFPVSEDGKFTKAQRDVYEIVLNCQLECIEYTKKCLQEKVSLHDIHNLSVNLLTKGLQKLGLLDPNVPVKDLVGTRKYFPYYPTYIGHYLGADVHDTPSIHRDIPLKPGMVITIEPGLYIQNTPNGKKEYQNIGVRIEDDVIITQNGIEIPTSGIPKHVDEIERLMQTKRLR